MTRHLRSIVIRALLLAAGVAALMVVPEPIRASHNQDCDAGVEYIYFTDSTYTYSSGYKYTDCDCNVTRFGQATEWAEWTVEPCW